MALEIGTTSLKSFRFLSVLSVYMAYTPQNNRIITFDDDSLNNDSDDVHDDSDDVHNNLSPQKSVSIVVVNIGALLERPFL